MSKPLIEIQHLSKHFGATNVLDNISLNIAENEVVAIIGTSGTGKSTLLRCLNYLTVPSEGVIRIAEAQIDAKKHSAKDIRNLRVHSAMVFQHYNLFKNKTALGNVMEALITVHHQSRSEAEQTALHYLAKVGMLDRKDFYPSKLSGGQQQRVAIARALAVKPNVLLLDEPTSALDPELVGEVLNTIQDLVKDGLTMILVTHEISFARDVASRILFMDQGKIVADGAPQALLDNPENDRLRQFLQYVR